MLVVLMSFKKKNDVLPLFLKEVLSRRKEYVCFAATQILFHKRLLLQEKSVLWKNNITK